MARPPSPLPAYWQEFDAHVGIKNQCIAFFPCGVRIDFGKNISVPDFFKGVIVTLDFVPDLQSAVDHTKWRITQNGSPVLAPTSVSRVRVNQFMLTVRGLRPQEEYTLGYNILSADGQIVSGEVDFLGI